MALTSVAPWSTTASETVLGINTPGGPITVLAAFAAIVLLWLAVRPAWMAAGLCAAVGLRELTRISSDEAASIAFGLPVQFVLALTATGLAVRSYLSQVKAPEPT